MKRDNGAFYNNADQKNGKAEPLPWNGTKKNNLIRKEFMKEICLEK